MGTPIPPPVTPPPVSPGDPCTTCWGSGKPFGDGDTPESIDILVSGINKGPDWIPTDGEPFEGLFTIPQNEFFPCGWILLFETWQFGLSFSAGQTNADIRRNLTLIMFTGLAIASCSTLISNDAETHFVNGSVQILIPGTI